MCDGLRVVGRCGNGAHLSGVLLHVAMEMCGAPLPCCCADMPRSVERFGVFACNERDILCKIFFRFNNGSGAVWQRRLLFRTNEARRKRVWLRCGGRCGRGSGLGCLWHCCCCWRVGRHW